MPGPPGRLDREEPCKSPEKRYSDDGEPNYHQGTRRAPRAETGPVDYRIVLPGGDASSVAPDQENGEMAITPVPNRGGLQSWQRTNLVAALSYLGDLIQLHPDDVRAKVVYEGLMEVLDPTRRALRTQRDLHTAARAASPVGKERRAGVDRRAAQDRRAIDLGSPSGAERRRGHRRQGDRRKT
jgi:hypothetical protein